MSRKNESKSKTVEITDKRVLTDVKLIYGGIHGVIVSYDDIDDSRDINYKISAKNIKFGAPASGDMVNAFDALKGDLLDICGYPLDGEDRAVLMNQVEVVGVHFKDDKGFIVTGKLDVLDGKTIALSTPLLKSEADYPGYGDIVGKIKAVYDETKEYLAGRKRLTNEQMIEQLERKNEIQGFDKEKFLQMTPAEQLKFAIDIAEEAGCNVLVPPNVEEDLEASDKIVEKHVKKIEEKVKGSDLPVSAFEDDEPVTDKKQIDLISAIEEEEQEEQEEQEEEDFKI